MADIMRMPEVLAGVEEATVTRWLVEPGATVATGEPIAELETDKAVVEVPSDADGVLARTLVSGGQSVRVGEPIAVLAAAGEGDADVDAAIAAIGGAAAPTPEPAGPAETTPASPAPTPSAEPTPEAAPASAGKRLFATPLVRRLAADAGVDLAILVGTGPRGRIVRKDLDAHLANRSAAPAATSAGAAATAAPSAAGFEDVPLSRMRGAIAARLTESKTTIPHFYLTADCRVDVLANLRSHINGIAPTKITFNDLVLKAVAAAFVEVPEANAIWNGTSIRRFTAVDISVAVAIDGGLITPVLRGVESMTITAIHDAMADLADRARSGSLRQDEIVGGSFSVSNLGMFGTGSFGAIINPPQSGILAVGAIRSVPVVDEDGQVRAGSVMTVTLSADHRVLDGALAAQWLASFQRHLENPLSLLI